MRTRVPMKKNLNITENIDEEKTDLFASKRLNCFIEGLLFISLHRAFPSSSISQM